MGSSEGGGGGGGEADEVFLGALFLSSGLLMVVALLELLPKEGLLVAAKAALGDPVDFLF
jgi:hypothetical protein